ncbi:MAG: PaaI family thioesterase [Pseudomonadota bacterium]
MTVFEPRNPNWERDVRAIFAAQTAMTTLAASPLELAPGRVALEAPFAAAFAQHDGFMHAGVATTLMDSACGGAAFTLMPPGCGVLTAELKASYLAPATGARFRAEGRVLKPGRTLTFCEGRAFAIAEDGTETLIATLSATMMTMRREG